MNNQRTQTTDNFRMICLVARRISFPYSTQDGVMNNYSILACRVTLENHEAYLIGNSLETNIECRFLLNCIIGIIQDLDAQGSFPASDFKEWVFNQFHKPPDCISEPTAYQPLVNIQQLMKQRANSKSNKPSCKRVINNIEELSAVSLLNTRHNSFNTENSLLRAPFRERSIKGIFCLNQETRKRPVVYSISSNLKLTPFLHINMEIMINIFYSFGTYFLIEVEGKYFGLADSIFVSSSHINCVPTGAIIYFNPKKSERSLFIDVYPKPDENSMPIFSVHNMNFIEPLSFKSEWTFIRSAKQCGWIQTQYIRFPSDF